VRGRERAAWDSDAAVCKSNGWKGPNKPFQPLPGCGNDLAPISLSIPTLYRHGSWCRCLLGCLLAGQRASPGSTQQWQQIAIPTIVASDPPGQDQEDGKTADDWVNTDGPGQQEVHVHEDSEEGGNPGQDPEDQSKADQHFP
jgi:hypothetical protein